MTDGPSRGAVLALGAAPAAVGRGLGNDLVVDDERVSRRHLRVSAGRGGVLVEDLGSRNGTLVGGRPVRGARIVRRGETIEIGRSTIALDPVETPAPRVVAGVPAACRRVRALLERDLDDELSAADREFMRAHLAGCRDCLARHDLERAWRDVLRDALAEELPPGLAARVGAALRAEAGP